MSRQLVGKVSIKESNLKGRVLFRPLQVALASLFGTPMSGFMALAWNYWQMGKLTHAKVTIMFGLLSGVALAWLYFYLPPTPYDRVFPLAIGCLVILFSMRFQGRSIQYFLIAKDYRPANLLNIAAVIASGVTTFLMLVLLLFAIGALSLS